MNSVISTIRESTMNEPKCEYRTVYGEKRLCQIVANLTKLPLAFCETNDSACTYCLACRTAPETPNQVTASMSIHAANRCGNCNEIIERMVPYLATGGTLEPDARCVLRGHQVRHVECKPCQAGTLTSVSVAVFRCSKHGECTLRNTGTFPKIQGCGTCIDRLSEYP